MSAAVDADAEALHQIMSAHENCSTYLNLGGAAMSELTQIPPQIAMLALLTGLCIWQCPISDLRCRPN